MDSTYRMMRGTVLQRPRETEDQLGVQVDIEVDRFRPCYRSRTEYDPQADRDGKNRKRKRLDEAESRGSPVHACAL